MTEIWSAFHEATARVALHEAGIDQAAPLAALLDRIAPGELRWYAPWRGAAPDIDSLGLMLHAASLCGRGDDPRVASWVVLLAHNAGPDGVVPVWLRRGPDGPTTADGAVPFGGDDCTVARLNLVFGLMCADPVGRAALIDANLRSCLARYANGAFCGNFHYTDTFAAALLARVAASPAPLARDLRSALDAAAADAIARLLAAWRLDGSLGSPGETAHGVLALWLRGALEPVRRPAMRYLSELQRPDGSWEAEHFYAMPGKYDSVDSFGCREVTTAWCLRALRLAAGGAHGR